jgi:hypothetical protein
VNSGSLIEFGRQFVGAMCPRQKCAEAAQRLVVWAQCNSLLAVEWIVRLARGAKRKEFLRRNSRSHMPLRMKPLVPWRLGTILA